MGVINWWGEKREHSFSPFQGSGIKLNEIYIKDPGRGPVRIGGFYYVNTRLIVRFGFLKVHL